MNEPDITYELKKSLKEVSGLNVTGLSEVALIDDERGSVFYYNLGSKTVTRSVQFAGKGDYEDLFVKGDTAYVLTSGGTLIEIISGKMEKARVRRYETGLSIKNDTEGLCYDTKRKVFLIACKGNAGLENFSEKYKGRKAVYLFNPQTMALNTTPEILIDVHKVENMIHGMQKNIIKRIMNLYNLTTKASFEPSGIAIHPITGEYYVISSSGNMMLIIDEAHRIKAAVRLPQKIFKQPEGITFDKSGNLYISNEGKSGKGNVLKFSYKKKS